MHACMHTNARAYERERGEGGGVTELEHDRIGPDRSHLIWG